MMDGRRLPSIGDPELAWMNDPETRERVRKLWDCAMPIFKKRGYDIWRNGNRWSVALFGERIVKTPIIFGTAGSLDKSCRDLEKMFYDPQTYELIKQEWEDRPIFNAFIPAYSKYNFNEHGETNANRHKASTVKGTNIKQDNSGTDI